MGPVPFAEPGLVVAGGDASHAARLQLMFVSNLRSRWWNLRDARGRLTSKTASATQLAT